MTKGTGRMSEQKHSISLSGYTPAEENNGLTALVDEFAKVKKPGQTIVVGIIERSSRTVKDLTGDVKAEARFTHLEVVDDAEDQEAMRTMLATLQSRRTGQVPLDMDEQAPDNVTDLP